MQRLAAVILVLSLVAPSSCATPKEATNKGPSLRNDALAICSEASETFDGHASKALRTADAFAAVTALVDVMASAGGCQQNAVSVAGDILCRDQVNTPGTELTPALRAVRAALESSDDGRILAGLQVLRTLTEPHCGSVAQQLLHASVPSIARVAGGERVAHPAIARELFAMIVRMPLDQELQAALERILLDVERES